MKKAIITAVQICITVGVLWIVFRDPTKRGDMLATLATANLGWLLLGFVICGVVEGVSGYRWHLLLKVQGIDLGLGRVMMLAMIGVFFNFFVPGGTGGDVAKIFYLLKETPGRRGHALISVLVDRIIGVFSLIALAAVIIWLQGRWLTSHPETAKYVWPVVILLAVSFVTISATFVVTALGLAHKVPPNFPWRDRIAELAVAYGLYGRAWRTTLVSFFISVAAHFGYFAIFWCAAKAVASGPIRTPTYGELCAIMPIVNTISALPISLGGIGVREGLFQVFLSNLASVTEAVAVVVSSTGYLLTLSWGIIGGLLYMLYKPSEHSRMREMKAQVAAVEHEIAEEEIALETAAEKAHTAVEPPRRT